VFKHTPMHPTSRAYEAQNPVGFTQYFVLPSFDEVVRLAAALGLTGVRGRHDHVASPGEALLVVLMRLRCKQSWAQLLNHPIYSTTPGHRWSATKMKEVFLATTIELHRLHGARITWSSWCFSQASCARYANHLCTMLGVNAHQNIIGITDGTHRAQSRPISVNGQNRQRQLYSGWLRKHCLGFQSVVTPDGLFASLCGPYPGSRNDRQKLTASQLMVVLGQRCPQWCILGEAEYTFNPAGQLERSIPGHLWPQGSWQAQYNLALAGSRVAICP
jgi:hypothetical protein